MNSAPSSSLTIAWRGWRGLAFVGATLCIAFLFFRAPEPASSASNASYRMLLDIAFRPASAATMPVQTVDGPLVPLQNPVYVGRSIWRPMVWQFVGNLIVAAIVAGSMVQLPATRAWWAFGLFLVVGMTESSIAPWNSP